jgi:hypothetical protein
MMIKRRGEWLVAAVGDELVMMSAEQGHYMGLSGVGPRIWELIETPHDLDTLCAKLQAEFEVEPEPCRSEVERFLEALVSHGAVTLDPPPAG